METGVGTGHVKKLYGSRVVPNVDSDVDHGYFQVFLKDFICRKKLCNSCIWFQQKTLVVL